MNRTQDTRKVNDVQAAVLHTALLESGIEPGEESLAIAGTCAALGAMFQMLTNVSGFYRTPEQYANCVRTMVLDIAKGNNP